MDALTVTNKPTASTCVGAPTNGISGAKPLLRILHLAHCSVPRAVVIGSLLSGLALGGCGGDSSAPSAPLDASQTFWALEVNYHGVNMATVAPYNTVQLHTVALNPTGDSLPGVGQPTYSTSDSSVSVSPTGLVTAHFATSDKPALVLVSKQYQGITLQDTVIVKVTDTLPQYPLATFQFEMRNGVPISALGDGEQPVTIRATTTTGQVVCDSISCPLALHYTSANPTIALFSHDPFTKATLSLRNPGHTFLTASTWYYGTVWSDTLTFTVNYRSHAEVQAFIVNNRIMYSAPSSIVLGVGADVTFGCSATVGCNTPIDIIFDDPSAADTASSSLFGGFIIEPPTGSGNIDAFGGDSATFANLFALARSRRFLKPGRYHYHSTVLPSDTNTILVLPGVQ
jgi:hypothetical protein